MPIGLVADAVSYESRVQAPACLCALCFAPDLESASVASGVAKTGLMTFAWLPKTRVFRKLSLCLSSGHDSEAVRGSPDQNKGLTIVLFHRGPATRAQASQTNTWIEGESSV